MSDIGEILSRLDLRAASEPCVERSPSAPESGTHAHVSEFVFAVLAALQAESLWTDVHAPHAKEAGWTIEEPAGGARRGLCVSHVSAEPLDVRVLNAREGAEPPLPDSRDPGAVFLAPGDATAHLLVAEDGAALIVQLDPDGSVVLSSFDLAGPEIEPLVTAHADVGAWLHPAVPPWLREEVALHAASGDAFHVAASVGLYQRLDAPGVTRPAASADLEALLAGEDSVQQRARGWMEGLDEAALATIVDLALAQVGLVSERLSAVVRDVSPHERAWRAELLDCLRARDDLHSVYGLLNLVGRARDLGAALSRFDTRYEAELAALPVRGVCDDARLRAAFAADPECYWGRLAMD